MATGSASVTCGSPCRGPRHSPSPARSTAAWWRRSGAQHRNSVPAVRACGCACSPRRAALVRERGRLHRRGDGSALWPAGWRRSPMPSVTTWTVGAVRGTVRDGETDSCRTIPAATATSSTRSSRRGGTPGASFGPGARRDVPRREDGPDPSRDDVPAAERARREDHLRWATWLRALRDGTITIPGAPTASSPISPAPATNRDRRERRRRPDRTWNRCCTGWRTRDPTAASPSPCAPAARDETNALKRSPRSNVASGNCRSHCPSPG